MNSTGRAVLTAASAVVLLTGCSFKGDSLKAPAGESATTVSATPSSTASTTSSPPVDTHAEDAVVEPSGTANAGSMTFCDVASMRGNVCTKPVKSFQGSRLGCATRVPTGRSVTLRILKDGTELVKESQKLGKSGKDGKVEVSGDVKIDPASLPAGIYSCEFSVDGGKPASGAIKVKGPQGKSGISQIRFCAEVPDKGHPGTTVSCPSGSDKVTVKPKTNLQCSAVVAGAKGHRLLVRIRKGERTFDFPFSAEQVNLNLGVVTAGVTLSSSADVRCEVHKDGARVAVRDFSLMFDGS